MSKSINYKYQPDFLSKYSAEFTGIEIDDFQSEAYSVFGQRVPLIDDAGNWQEHISIEHIGYTYYKLKWGERFHNNLYVEWICRSWMIDRIAESIDLRPNIKILSIIADLDISENNPESIERDIYEWVCNLLANCRREEREHIYIGARLLYKWSFENELPGFSEESMDEITWRGEIRHSSSNLVRFYDIQSGPYTAEELGILDKSIAWSSKVSIRQRAQFLVCRDWGLRPIQIALLRPEDLGEDDLGPYLNVPSVKGIRRSRLRRAPGNFVKRYISDDTDMALKKQISFSEMQCEKAKDRLSSLMKRFGIEHLPPIGLFPTNDRTEARLEQFCKDLNIFDYALHAQSHSITREIAELTNILSIPMRRADQRMDQPKIMSVTAYRLRRTKGISLVLSGHSREEVAEALDHVRVDSVAQYFQYSQDVHDFIDKGAANNPSIAEAVSIWDGRFAEDDPVEDGDRPIGSLGKCKRTTICPDQPAVTCYACHSFRPSINADHESALKSIEIFEEQVLNLSTSGLRGKLEREISGAKALIKVIYMRKMR